MSSSSTTCLKLKQCLAKENDCRSGLFILSCLIIGILLLFHGLKEFYKVKTLVIGQCQVKSIDLKNEKNNVYPLWFVTILHDNQKSESIIIGSTGYWGRYAAWNAAHDYRINETHPCYYWKSLISTSVLGWQWNKPPESKIDTFLFSGITLVVISIIIPILRRRYQAEFEQNQQQQIEMRSTNQQSSLPTYDEAIRSLTPTTTTDRNLVFIIISILFL